MNTSTHPLTAEALIRLLAQFDPDTPVYIGRAVGLPDAAVLDIDLSHRRGQRPKIILTTTDKRSSAQLRCNTANPISPQEPQ